MDVQYIVDSAAELGQITPVEHAAIYLLDPAYRQVDQLIAEDRMLGDDFLQNTARTALREATQDQRHWVVLNSLRSVSFLVPAVQGRAQQILQKKIQSDLGKCAPFRMIEGMTENGDTFWSEKMVRDESEVTETVARAILTKHMGTLIERLRDDNESLDAAFEWYQRDGGAAFRQLQISHRATMNVRESLSGAAYAKARASEKKRLKQVNKRPVRAAIKKVAKLFATFNQENNLRMFVSGHEVVLSHPDSKLKFVLKPLGEPGWLEERSAKGRAHTPYDLSVLTKDDIFITKLCVYFNDTPVLDQLLAMSLFVEAGEELKILEKANFYGFSEDRKVAQEAITTAYPSLAKKFPQPREAGVTGFELEEVVLPGHRYPVIDLGAPFREEEAHWEPFKGRMAAWVNTWFEPVFSQLLPKAELLQLT
jgi:hypothetical protein